MGLYRGGRPKGTKNKKTDLFRKCDEIGVDVFTELLTIAHSEPIPDKRFSKFHKLAEFLYAKPKDQGEVELTPEQVREMIREWSRDADEDRGKGDAG